MKHLTPTRTTLSHLVLFLVVALFASSSSAVKRGDFKTCAQSGFCRRNRAFADRANEAQASWKSPYSIKHPIFTQGSFRAAVSNLLFPTINFSLEVRFQQDGVARVLMDEVDGLRQRYNETATWAVQTEPVLAVNDDEFEVSINDATTSIKYANGRHELKIQHQPILLTFFRDGQPHMVFNDAGLLNMEHFRVKPVGVEPEEVVVQDAEHPGEQIVIVKEDAFPGFLPKDDDGMWEESFGGKLDPKPKGPESFSLDIEFVGYEHVYGIPQHASTLSLKETRGKDDKSYTDPYRLYNLDVFEYETDSEMAIYGAIPLMKAHRPGSTVGVFVSSGSEMWIDITKGATPKTALSAFKKSKKVPEGDGGPAAKSTKTHWMAESGTLDVFVFLGPTSEDIFQQFTALTGRTALPQYFATAYHQCRWNYVNEADVLGVQSRMDEADIPMDVEWLDIEYAAEHKYFIWDRRHFPTPEKMQAELAARGRKLVTIIDPHIKRTSDLYVYTEAQELDVLSKTSDGKEFEGWCWTGSSAWVDFFNPKSWQWWIDLFKYEKFVGSTPILFVWNDMNEPSIFNGPEITMQKDTIHYGGWEHRDIHNINGMIYHNVTASGLIQRDAVAKRPFVLSRAFFAGSQRFGAIWTGDNLGTWRHLASTLPMLLTNGIAGMTFAGSDVGGFFGNPPPEMFVRWYQVGAISPFFRAHGHLDTKRREPYLFEEPFQGYIRDAIRLRYTLLPMLYTAFYESSLTGSPILKPQYVVFPHDAEGFAIEDQTYIANSGLLAKPVVTEGASQVEVYIADAQPYYHYSTHDIYFGRSTGGAHIKVPAPLGSLPLFHRGGSILPRRDLVRRASTLTWRDPITLVVALDITGTSASGSLYLDDGESYAHEQGEFIYRGFTLEPVSKGSKSLALRSRSLHDAVSSTGLDTYSPSENAWAQKIKDVTVREIVILGLTTSPSCIKLAGSNVGLEFEWINGVGATSTRRGGGKAASKLVIHDAGASIISNWDIVFDFDGSSCDVAPAIDHEAALESPECGPGRFLCRNEGHISSCILRSRFNDGVCDPECCDGSDETDGKADCPNRCAAVGAEHRKKLAEEARKVRVGASIRKDYITFGTKEKTKIQGEVEKLKQEIAELKAREQTAQSRLDELEQADAGEIERKKDSQLYEKIVEMQVAIKALRMHRANLEGHVGDLSGILSDLTKTFNPNYQDMAVLGATRAFKDWQKANHLVDPDADPEDVEAGEAVPPPPHVEGEEEVKDYSDAELKVMEDEDPLSLIDSLSTRVGRPGPSTVATIFKIDEYVPEAWRPKFDAYKESLVQLLVRTGIIYAPPAAGGDRPELTRARDALAKASDSIHAAEKKLGDGEASLAKNWGRQWEWKKLDGTCVEQDTGEYTYSVCFFGEAQQRASNGHGGRTSLGRFKGWSSTAEEDTDAYYSEQLYADGQRCWNGPLRSAQVKLICGTSNALVSVWEPEKCEYQFTVATPAVCFDGLLEQAEAKQKGEVVKDEL